MGPERDTGCALTAPVARVGLSMGWALFLLTAPLAGAWLFDLSHHEQMMASYGHIAQMALVYASSLSVGALLVPIGLLATIVLLFAVPVTWIFRGWLVGRYYRRHPEVLKPEWHANRVAWVTQCHRVETECERLRGLLMDEQRRRKLGHEALTAFALDLHKADEQHEAARELAASKVRRTLLEMGAEPQRVTRTLQDMPALEGR